MKTIVLKQLLSSYVEVKSIMADLISTEVGPLMYKLYQEQIFTDVMFFSRNSKTSLFAHRAVMAAKSDYFANLLFGDQMSGVVGMQMQVEITHTPFSVFTDIVNYCYTGDIELTNDHTVLEIYAAALVFQIGQLTDQCKIYIESMGLTEDNVCSILQICNSKQIEELKERCISYIKKNTYAVIKSTDFEKCSFSTVREICELQSLNLSSEGELLDAVLRWVNVQPKHTKKELVKSFLKCIRFLSFNPKQFSDFIQKNSEVMPAEEGLKILMYLNNRTTEFFESLPKWCNKTSRTLKADVKTNSFKGVPEERSLGESKVKIYLKPTGEKHISELTSIVRMKCIQGKHEIKAIRFSFEEFGNNQPDLVYLHINVKIFPGFSFNKNFTVKSEETLYYFSKPISLSENKILQIEVLARINKFFGFLQFRRWHNDRKDFQIFVSSRPNKGNFNCISEILYSTY